MAKSWKHFSVSTGHANLVRFIEKPRTRLTVAYSADKRPAWHKKRPSLGVDKKQLHVDKHIYWA
jgi:hypothetical protein